MEGAGVRVCRTLGTGALRNLDPFLMLDELRMPASQATAGFPNHPHRGFETCSIMLSGKMQHKDNYGNEVCPEHTFVHLLLPGRACMSWQRLLVNASECASVSKPAAPLDFSLGPFQC